MTSSQDNLTQADEALGKLRAALDDGRVEEAVGFGREAVDAAPRYVPAIAGLVRALGSAGRATEARHILDAMPQQVAGSPAQLVELAEACLSHGVDGMAKEMLQTALEADPQSAQTAELLARVLFSGGDTVAVVAVCEPFRLRGAVTPTLTRMLAAAHEQLGDLPTATERAREYARLAYLDPHAHYHLGTLEHRAGDFHEAMRRYHLVLELGTADAEIRAAAVDGIHALDALQLRHITVLAAEDAAFLLALSRDPRDALHDRGFALSEEGWAILAGMDLRSLSRGLPRPPGRGYH